MYCSAFARTAAHTRSALALAGWPASGAAVSDTVTSFVPLTPLPSVNSTRRAVTVTSETTGRAGGAAAAWPLAGVGAGGGLVGGGAYAAGGAAGGALGGADGGGLANDGRPQAGHRCDTG